MPKRHRIGFIGAIAFAIGGCSNAHRDPSDIDDLSESKDEATLASIAAAEDSYATSYSNTGRGSRTELKVGSTPEVQETYLKFNVAGLPTNAIGIKATLTMKATNTSAAIIEVHTAKSNAWSEATLSAANAPGFNTAIITKATGTIGGSSVSFDVSSAVAGNGTISLVLRTPSGASTIFASKEAGAASAPTLSVTYSLAPTLTPTLFGAAYNPHTNARYDQLAAQWGGVNVVRSYDNGKGALPFLSAFQADDVKHNAASAYSFKYLPKDVIAGNHDADLRSFFQGIVDNHAVYWTYYHEPDDELYKTHTFTPTEYRAAWAHIKAIANQVKATRPNLKIFATSIIMEYSMRPKIAPGRPLLGTDGMYPGDDVIDVFGVDAYANDIGVTDVAEQFGKIIDFASAHKKPWAIGEIGACPQAGDAAARSRYMTDAFKYWKARNSTPVYAAYFNVDWSAASCDYRFDTDTAAITVWKTATTKGLSSF